MLRNRSTWRSGVTLIELMVVIALVAVVVTLAAPSFTRMIEMQRLRGVHDQLMTDIQFARSEAARLGLPVQLFVRASTSSRDACYVIYSTTDRSRPSPASNYCDCALAPGQECLSSPSTLTALRTVRIPRSHKIGLQVPASVQPQGSLWRMAYDPATGAMAPARSYDFGAANPDRFEVQTFLDTQRILSAVVSFSGRPTTCAPSGSTVKVAPC